MNITLLAVIVAGILLVLIVGYFKEKERQKRIKELKDIASTLRFSFTAKVGTTFLDKIREFYLYNRQGSSPEVRNLMTGEKDGLQVSIFDFHYTIGDQKVSTRYSQSVLLLESEQLHLPFFILRPESVLDKIGTLFGGQDIDFSSNPRFSDHYLLRGEQEDRIRETFSPQVISYYEGHHKVYTEGNKKKLLFFTGMGKDLITPEKLPDLMKSGIQAGQIFLQKNTSSVV